MDEQQALPPAVAEVVQATQQVPPPTPAQTGQPAPAPGPQFVPFVVDGETYQLDSRLADRLAREQSTPPAYAPQPQQQWQPAQQQAPQPQEPNLEDLMFRNPREFLRTYRDEIKREIFTEYQREQTEQKFWNTLYQTDASMRQVPREFVNSIVVQNQRALAGLTDDQAMQRVSSLVKERIANVLGLGQNTQQPAPASYADGGSSPGQAPQSAAAPTPGEPQTLSQALKSRRMIRQGLS